MSNRTEGENGGVRILIKERRLTGFPDKVREPTDLEVLKGMSGMRVPVENNSGGKSTISLEEFKQFRVNPT